MYSHVKFPGTKLLQVNSHKHLRQFAVGPSSQTLQHMPRRMSHKGPLTASICDWAAKWEAMLWVAFPIILLASLSPPNFWNSAVQFLHIIQYNQDTALSWNQSQAKAAAAAGLLTDLCNQSCISDQTSINIHTACTVVDTPHTPEQGHNATWMA